MSSIIYALINLILAAVTDFLSSEAANIYRLTTEICRRRVMMHVKNVGYMSSLYLPHLSCWFVYSVHKYFALV